MGTNELNNIKSLAYRTTTYLKKRGAKTAEAAIIIRLTYDSKRIDLGTGLSVVEKSWDSKSESVKRGYKNKQGLTYTEINDGIADKKRTINAIFKQYELTGKYPTPQQVREAYREAYGATPKAKRTLLSFYDEFMASRGIQNSWSEGTYKKFMGIRNKFAEFDSNLRIEDLDEQKLTAIISHFQRYWENNSTFTKRWQDVNAFFKWCNTNDYPINAAYRSFKIKLKIPKRMIIYLEKDELLRVYNYQFSEKDKHLELYRDWFCLSAFTSLRYSDVKQLRKKDIYNDCINLTTKKDVDAVSINLNKYSRAIIDKYKDNPFAGEYVMPRVHNVLLNNHIKQICRLCKIDTPITKVHYEGTKRIEQTLPKYEFVVSHTGRKTFICLALSMGIPPTTVMAWSGHDSYDDMKPYIKITDEAKASAMTKFDSIDEQSLSHLEEVN